MEPLPHKEIEVKLELAPKGLSSFRQIPLIRQLKRNPRRATEVSVYFDTDKHKLRKKGCCCACAGLEIAMFKPSSQPAILRHSIVTSGKRRSQVSGRT
jgi:hypothetical protein